MSNSAKTRRAYKRLERRYSRTTRMVVAALRSGKNPYKSISHQSHQAVPAIKANYSRGTYDWAFV